MPLAKNISMASINDIISGRSRRWLISPNDKIRSIASRTEIKPTAKLTPDQVLSIRELFQTGKYEINKIAKMFSISTTTCQSILKRKTWKFI